MEANSVNVPASRLPCKVTAVRHALERAGALFVPEDAIGRRGGEAETYPLRNPADRQLGRRRRTRRRRRRAVKDLHAPRELTPFARWRPCSSPLMIPRANWLNERGARGNERNGHACGRQQFHSGFGRRHSGADRSRRHAGRRPARSARAVRKSPAQAGRRNQSHHRRHAHLLRNRRRRACHGGARRRYQADTQFPRDRRRHPDPRHPVDRARQSHQQT